VADFPLLVALFAADFAPASGFSHTLLRQSNTNTNENKPVYYTWRLIL
jgi:hypothetical protein